MYNVHENEHIILVIMYIASMYTIVYNELMVDSTNYLQNEKGIEIMRTIELVNGQIIEEYSSIKEIRQYIEDSYINNKDFLDGDSSLWIEYKDGSIYYICGTEEEGTYKKTGIKTVVESNPSTYSVYGSYQLIKTDPNDDDENCAWLVYPE